METAQIQQQQQVRVDSQAESAAQESSQQDQIEANEGEVISDQHNYQQQQPSSNNEDQAKSSNQMHSANSQQTFREVDSEQQQQNFQAPQHMYNEEDQQNFKQIFDMFDQGRTGLLQTQHLTTVFESLDRDPQEAVQLLNQIYPQQVPDQITFQEFLELMFILETQMGNGMYPQQNQQHESFSNDNDESGIKFIDANDSQTPAMNQQEIIAERNKFGPLIPRTGVNCAPDQKICDFLKLLKTYGKQCQQELNHVEARKCAVNAQQVIGKETIKQLKQMKQAQKVDYQNIEYQQRSVFNEFSHAWDKYMSEYESNAFHSLEQLKQKHVQEIRLLHEQIRMQEQKKTCTQSKQELLRLTELKKKMTYQKRYEEAEFLMLQIGQLQQQQIYEHEARIDEKIEKEEVILRKKQNAAVQSLLARIQRDRNEQLKHRQTDSQRLMQRNQNLVNDLTKNQSQESRRTQEYLRMALGKRSPDKHEQVERYKSHHHGNHSVVHTRLSLPKIAKSQLSMQSSPSGLHHNASTMSKLSRLSSSPEMKTANMITRASNNASGFRPLTMMERQNLRNSMQNMQRVNQY